MLKRFLKYIYRFGTNRWVNVIFGILLYFFSGWSFFNLGYSIHYPSFALALLAFISIDIFNFGISQFFVKKPSDDPSKAPHEDNAA